MPAPSPIRKGTPFSWAQVNANVSTYWFLEGSFVDQEGGPLTDDYHSGLAKMIPPDVPIMPGYLAGALMPAQIGGWGFNNGPTAYVLSSDVRFGPQLAADQWVYVEGDPADDDFGAFTNTLNLVKAALGDNVLVGYALYRYAQVANVGPFLYAARLAVRTVS